MKKYQFYITNRLIIQLLQGFAFRELMEEKFFFPDQLGNFTKMTNGMIDVRMSEF